jgi:type IX secretion system PorP/SprF family membrane protein
VQRLFILLFILVPLISLSQTDPHFSQYYHYTSAINPAMTGIMNGSVRLSAIYRNQWNSISRPFETPGIQAEVSTNRNLNFGASVMSQQAGDGGFRYTQSHLSINYTGIRWGINEQHHLSVGIQAGFIQRSFEPSKLRLGDQWVPGIGYNPNLSSNDIFPVRNSLVPDISTGIFYFNDDPDKTILPFFGAAAFHLNQPADPFVTSNDLPYIPVRYVLQGGLQIQTENENILFTPHVIYMQQGTALNVIAGGQMSMYVNDDTRFLAGAYYRWNDAITPFAGLAYNRMTLGVSYDVTTSALSRFVNGTGSFEISLSYMFDKKEKRSPIRFECPRF